MSGFAESGRFSPGRMTALLTVLLLSLGGCGWPMDPVPNWDYTVHGTVVRAGSAAPVANARVQLWFTSSTGEPEGRPFVDGLTDARGAFRIQGRLRDDVPPPYAAIRVDPPAGSGLASRTLSGVVRDFATQTRDGSRITLQVPVVLDAVP